MFALGSLLRTKETQPRDVLADRRGEIRGHLHLSNPGLGLRVKDLKAPAIATVQTHLTDPQVTQLTDAHARVPKDLNHHPPPAITMTDTHAEAAQVKAHRPLRHTEALRDLSRPVALVQQALNLQRSRAQPRVRRSLGFVLFTGGS